MNEELRLFLKKSLEETENLDPEQKLAQIMLLLSDITEKASDTWNIVWKEFDDSVVEGIMVSPLSEKGFKPKCGWADFLEKVWELKNYLDLTKSFCKELL